MNTLENFEKEDHIEKRAHTDPELLEATANQDVKKLRKIIEDILSKSPLYEGLPEKEKEELIQREIDYLNDKNKQN